MINKVRIAAQQATHNRFLVRNNLQAEVFNPGTRNYTQMPIIKSGGYSTNPVTRIIRWFKEFKFQLQQARNPQAPVKVQELEEPIVTTAKKNVKFN